MRYVMLVDMDAYFASVEQRCNPALCGKPIAVIGSDKRTVVTTCSYEARAYGVKTGMNVYEAKKLCPGLIFITGNNRKYTYTCAELAKTYAKYTDTVEVYSIDESFLDVTDTHHLFGGPIAIGNDIKKEIKRLFGLNVTIGISYNKLMAKLASDLAKPDGLRLVGQEEAPLVLEDLPAGKLWGIGRGTESRLRLMGINTCGELGRAPVTLLRARFGIIGSRLKAMGLGLDASVVSGEQVGAKSVGHSMTLPRDIYKREEIEACLMRLAEMVGRRARKHSLMGRVVTVVIRYKSFKTFTRQKKMHNFTNDTHDIYLRAMEIIDSERLEEPVRLLGISLSGIVEDCGQEPLFEEERRRRKLLRAMDAINDRFGDGTIEWAIYNSEEVRASLRPARVISPAWRPGGVRKTSV